MRWAASSAAPEARLVVLLGALVAFGPLAVDLYLPALPAIAAGLGAPAGIVQLSVTVFLAGFSVGMLFYGPVSDRFGRRPVMLSGILLFALASLGCMLASSVEQLIAARLLQALGGGAASVLARAVVRDLYDKARAIRILSLMATVTAIAPLVAPLAGSALLRAFGWRASFAALLLWGLASLAVVARQLPETLPAAARGRLSLGGAFAAYGRLLADPAAVGLVLAGAWSFAAMFAYITGGAFYFISYRQLSPSAYGTLFAANAIGILAANYANSRLVMRWGAARIAGAGSLLGLAGAALLPAAIDAPAGLPVVIAAMFVAVAVTGLLGANCVGLLMERYPDNAGAAAATFGAAQFGFGALASAGVSCFHDGSGRPMAWTMLIASAVSLAGYLLFHFKGGQGK